MEVTETETMIVEGVVEDPVVKEVVAVDQDNQDNQAVDAVEVLVVVEVAAEATVTKVLEMMVTSLMMAAMVTKATMTMGISMNNHNGQTQKKKPSR